MRLYILGSEHECRALPLRAVRPRYPGEALPIRELTLLHASDIPSPPEAPWAAPFAVPRWDDVRHAMAVLVADGVTASMDAVEEVAVAAYQQLTGSSYEDYLGEFEEYLFPDYADA
jgi:hypothetical protein